MIKIFRPTLYGIFAFTFILNLTSSALASNVEVGVVHLDSHRGQTYTLPVDTCNQGSELAGLKLIRFGAQWSDIRIHAAYIVYADGSYASLDKAKGKLRQNQFTQWLDLRIAGRCAKELQVTTERVSATPTRMERFPAVLTVDGWTE